MRKLEAFAMVARTGSFTAAAAELRLTTPAVSKIVSRLERSLGTRLFIRSTRRLSLTAEGRMFLGKVTLALAHVNEAVDLLREAQQEPSGTVRLWTNAAIGKDHVLPMLAEFLDRYPRISVDVRFDDGVPDLAGAGYDLAVHHTAIGGGSNAVTLLAELPLALVASPAYLSRHGAPRSPAELNLHQCIATRSSTAHATVWEFRRERDRTGRTRVTVEPKGRVVISEQYDAVINATLCGLGVTVVFAHSVLRYLEAGELKVLLPDWLPRGGTDESNNVYLRYPHRKHLSYSVRLLVEFLAERFREPSRVKVDLRRWAI